ncbi:hypothetical protein [Streptomyces sp. Ru73]|uniref:hypothetical protein n=1 Tax=Streptomyces sp. Ru73 TaxID=2080748 RepID=UPI0021563241|nr:hypothetical protein [Streptomyces sp. Ru73]
MQRSPGFFGVAAGVPWAEPWSVPPCPALLWPALLWPVPAVAPGDCEAAADELPADDGVSVPEASQAVSPNAATAITMAAAALRAWRRTVRCDTISPDSLVVVVRRSRCGLPGR